jgi:hypothetical protein
LLKEENAIDMSLLDLAGFRPAKLLHNYAVYAKFATVKQGAGLSVLDIVEHS